MSKLSHTDLKALIQGAGLTEMEFRAARAGLQEIPEGVLDYEVTTEMTRTKLFVALFTMVSEQNPDAVDLLQALIPEKNLPKVVQVGPLRSTADGGTEGDYRRTLE